MHIQNIDEGAHSLSHGDKVYTGKDGVFDVPDEVADSLVNFPHWRRYDGNPWPHPKSEEQIEAEKTAAIVKQVVAEMNRPEPKHRK